MFGFFSTRIAIDSVFGMVLVTPIGTTAPFSAMSGVWKNTMSLLCAGAPPPIAFTVSSIDLRFERRLVPGVGGQRLARLQPSRGRDERQQRDAAARLQHLSASCVHRPSSVLEKHFILAPAAVPGRRVGRASYAYFAPPRIHCSAFTSGSFACGHRAGVGGAPPAPVRPALADIGRAPPGASQTSRASVLGGELQQVLLQRLLVVDAACDLHAHGPADRSRTPARRPGSTRRCPRAAGSRRPRRASARGAATRWSASRPSRRRSPSPNARPGRSCAGS